MVKSYIAWSNVILHGKTLYCTVKRYIAWSRVMLHGYTPLAKQFTGEIVWCSILTSAPTATQKFCVFQYFSKIHISATTWSWLMVSKDAQYKGESDYVGFFVLDLNFSITNLN